MKKDPTLERSITMGAMTPANNEKIRIDDDGDKASEPQVASAPDQNPNSFLP